MFVTLIRCRLNSTWAPVVVSAASRDRRAYALGKQRQSDGSKCSCHGAFAAPDTPQAADTQRTPCLALVDRIVPGVLALALMVEIVLCEGDAYQ
jgi:hypothetical protein